MTLETRSFFIGIATVAGLVVLGFGGGILLGGVLSGDNKPNKIERQAVAKDDEKPAQLAIPEAQAKPVPVIETKSAVTALPAEPPQAPRAAPPAAQQEPAPAATVATSVGSSLNSDLSLGPEKPAALTHPAAEEQSRPLSRREEARMRKEQRRAERELRREERRKLIAERRERDMMRREEARAQHMTRQDFDADDEDERPVVREFRPRAPDLPFFRIFN